MAHVCEEGALCTVGTFGIFTGGFRFDTRIIRFLQRIREGCRAVRDRGFEALV